MNSSISKQIIINQLPLPTEINDYIKDFIFYDKVLSQLRKNKKILTDILTDRLIYFDDTNGGHWGLTVRGDTQLQAINCMHCGGYVFAGELILPSRATCTCSNFLI
jgi:hypothetical protein